MKKYLFISFLLLYSCVKVGREIPQKAETGGTIAIGISEDFESLVPVYPSFRQSNAIFDLIFYPLIRVEKNKVYPGVASEWEFSEDLKTITFYLRRDAKWHDGKPVTAKDFVFTYNLIVSPNSTSPLKANFRFVKSVKAVSDYVLRIEFTRSYSSQLVDCEIYPLPEHILKGVKNIRTSEYWDKPIGNGPYKILDHVRGDILILEKFKDFFEKSGFVDKIVFKIYETPQDVAQALKMNLIDVALSINAEVIDSFLLDWENGEIDYYPSSKVIYLGFNLKKEPFNNKDIRKALIFLMNPDEWISDVFDGYALKAKSIVPPVIWAFNPDLKDIPFNNTETGIDILSNSGYTKRKPLVINLLFDKSQEVYARLAGKIKENLEKTNLIKVNIVALEPLEFVTRLLNSKFDVYILSFTLDEKADLSHLLSSKGLLNFMGYSNRKVDSLISASMMTLNRKKAKRMLAEVQSIVQEELPVVPLLIPQEMYAYSSRLQNIKNFTGDLLISNLDLVWIPTGERMERVSFELKQEEEVKPEKPKEKKEVKTPAPETTKRKIEEKVTKKPEEPKPTPPKPEVTAEEILQKKIAEEAAKKVEAQPEEEKPAEEVAKAPAEEKKEEEPEEAPPPPQMVPTVMPVVKKSVQPEYPDVAKKLGAHGTVFLRVLIGVDGKVKDVKVLRSSGYDFLDNAAKEAAKKYEFEPAKDKEGKPVATWFPIKISF